MDRPSEVRVVHYVEELRPELHVEGGGQEAGLLSTCLYRPLRGPYTRMVLAEGAKSRLRAIT